LSKFCVPVEKPKPDSDRFINVLMGKESTDKPPIFDFSVDDEVMRLILEKLIGRKWIYPYKVEAAIKKATTNDKQSIAAYWVNYIEFWYRMGYDTHGPNWKMQISFRLSMLPAICQMG